MKDFSFRRLFCIACCPPWPPKIAEKIAFRPPCPSYCFLTDSSKSLKNILFINNDSTVDYSMENVDCLLATTSRGNKIGCIFIKRLNAKYTILFSHGNAADLGLMFAFFNDLCDSLSCNIFGYDYSGYGISTGRPSEKNMYADIECAWGVLEKTYHILPEQIVLYGQSIGTVPTVDLAARRKVGAVVLHSPLLSAFRVINPSITKTYCCDFFLNIDKVSGITSPVLVIHGDSDEMVPFSHGLTIFEKCRCSVHPLWILGAGHNSIECYVEYLERLRKFITYDIEQVGKKETVHGAKLESVITENNTEIKLENVTVQSLLISKKKKKKKNTF